MGQPSQPTRKGAPFYNAFTTTGRELANPITGRFLVVSSPALGVGTGYAPEGNRRRPGRDHVAVTGVNCALRTRRARLTLIALWEYEMQNPPSPPVATPSLELKWRRYFLVLVILTSMMLLIAIAVAVTTSRSGSVETTSAEGVQVWADGHIGRYFCPGSAWYGRTKMGEYVTEKQARLAGFRPDNDRPCESPRPPQNLRYR